MSNSELLACDFCGGDGACYQEEDDGYGYVICVCTAQGPLRKGEAEAIAAWNTRVQLDELRAENARLKFDLGNMEMRARHLLSCIDNAGDLDREDVIFIDEARKALGNTNA
jgi:hypothetical protein